MTEWAPFYDQRRSG